MQEAFQIDLVEDFVPDNTDEKLLGALLCVAGPLWLATSGGKTGAVGKSIRIGLTRNVDRKLRFYERDNPYVSGPKRLRE